MIMKKLLLIFLMPFAMTAQVQIGTEINGLFAGDSFGNSIALSDDGSVVAIGANLSDANGSDSGQVRVFKNSSGTWTLIGDAINGTVAGDHAGFSVALSANGNILAVGSPRHFGFSGEVRIYWNQAGNWVQTGTIDGESFGDNSGWSLSFSADGSVLAIGAIGRYTNGFETGSAKIYRNIAGVWTQEGNTIEGTINTKSLGRSLCLSANGNTLAVSEPYTTINGAYSGRVNVFQNMAGVWTQIGNGIDGTFANGIFGYSIDLSSDGSVVAIGAPGTSPNGSNVGLVKVYTNTSGTWSLMGSVLNGVGANAAFGRCVGLSADGNTLAVASNNFQSDFTSPGRIQIFVFQSGNWLQKGSNIDGDPAELFGASLALSANGNIVASGATFNSEAGANAGQVRIFDVSNALATQEFVLEDIRVYPNPATDNLTVSIPETYNLKSVSLYDVLGQVVRKNDNRQLNVSGLSKGIYFLDIVTDKGKATKKIVIN